MQSSQFLELQALDRDILRLLGFSPNAKILQWEQVPVGTLEPLEHDIVEIPKKHLESELGEPPAVWHRAMDPAVEWRREEKQAIWSQHAINLVNCQKRLADMLQNLDQQDRIERGVFNQRGTTVADVAYISCIAATVDVEGSDFSAFGKGPGEFLSLVTYVEDKGPFREQRQRLGKPILDEKPGLGKEKIVIS